MRSTRASATSRRDTSAASALLKVASSPWFFAGAAARRGAGAASPETSMTTMARANHREGDASQSDIAAPRVGGA